MESQFGGTEAQSVGERMDAEARSRVATIPPAQIPGYRIERQLGSGAFGQVWVGVDQNTGRRVAIKFYLRHAMMDWKLLSREVRHLVSMAADRHIVQVLAVGWDHEPPYYVMEYLPNGSLQSYVAEQRRIPVDEALAIFAGIADGLNHAHDRGILHCDLKPANILLDASRQPRIADFGQSRMSDEQTPSLGTLFYMAPEQADLQAIPEARWDVYALGAILYCMLVGHPPHFSEERLSTLREAEDLVDRLAKYRQLLTTLPSPREHYKIPAVDRDLAQILDRMLHRDSERRFANVQQVIDALQQRAQERIRRPLLLLGTLGPLLLLGVVTLFFWRGVATAREQSTRRLQREALRSNEFAAGLAARTMERDLSHLYQAIEAESSRRELQQRLQELEAVMPPASWEAIAAGRLPRQRQLLFESPERQQFHDYIKGVFDRFNKNRRGSALDSMFVLGRRGTMLVTTFADELESNRVGENFAYRTYFHGEAMDREPGQTSGVQPLRRTHLSSPFLSTTTYRWKIAISTPIFAADQPADSQAPQSDAAKDGTSVTREVIGVLVATINLGDFVLLSDPPPDDRRDATPRDPAEPAFSRFAVLVDGRSGPTAGTLVQHPLLKALADAIDQGDASVQSMPSLQISQSQLAQLRRGGMVDYQDPAAQHPAGQGYAGDWLASLQTVELPEPARPGESADGGGELLVLVQEPASSTAGPVSELVNALTREFLVAIAAMAIVVISIWYFAVRAMRKL